jgi:hypothetical protein
VSLEYAIEYPCPVRQRITTEQIVAITRTIAWLDAVRDAALATGNVFARVVCAVTTLQGQESREYTVAQLAGEAAEQSHRYAAMCRVCPVARRLQTGRFGCVGQINYPISARCEEQLAVVAQRAWTERTPALVTIKAMVDAHFGRTRSEQTWMGHLRREQRGTERATPVSLLHLKRHEELTTDHLLSLLLSNGTMRGNRLRLVAAFLREVRPSFQAFLEKLSGAGQPVMADREQWGPLVHPTHRRLNVRTAEESLYQFMAFADAVLLAEELNCAVYLDG